MWGKGVKVLVRKGLSGTGGDVDGKSGGVTGGE